MAQEIKKNNYSLRDKTSGNMVLGDLDDDHVYFTFCNENGSITVTNGFKIKTFCFYRYVQLPKTVGKRMGNVSYLWDGSIFSPLEPDIYSPLDADFLFLVQ